MNARRYWICIAAIGMTAILTAGCPTGGYIDASDGDATGGDEVPVETIFFVENPDTGAITMQTNDIAHLGPDGKTFWHMGEKSDPIFQTVSVRLSKLSGRPEMGYGITFAMQDINNYLTVMITTTGSYIIGRVEHREFSPLTAGGNWVHSDDLRQGYNRNNVVTVTRAGDGTFTLTINNKPQQTFTDGASSPYSGGAYGHLVTFSPYENFPYEPVRVVFVPLDPADIGVKSQIDEGEVGTTTVEGGRQRHGYAVGAFGRR